MGHTAAPTPPTPVTDTWSRVHEIWVPVLAACGELDSIDHRAVGRRLAGSVPNGRFRDIPNSADYPNLENPTAFNAAVQELLATI